MVVYYWITEYSRVFCGYLFLMFVWPSVVFHKHLRTRSKTYRFGFCVTVPIVIMNTVVLGLGLLHGLSQWLVGSLLYGVFILAFLKNFVAYLDRKYRRVMETEFPNVRSLMGKYRKLVIFLLFFVVCYRYGKRVVRFLCIDFWKKIKTCNWTKVRLRVKEGIWSFGRQISSLFWQYGILALVIIYGMVYFSYGAFRVHSYGYGDLYTHHKWIYGLIEGNIFVEGVYPEAMHCFIYCMHTLFGIKIYSILLFLQGIHVAVFLLSAYLLLRKVFIWRYTSVFVLMMFLTLDLCNADLIHSMFRLQITMPMEFGLHTVCLSALFLINYLDRERIDGSSPVAVFHAAERNDAVVADRKVKKQKYFWDEDLLLFMMALAAVVMTHFHAMLMALIVCASFAVFAFKKICSRKYLIPLTTVVFCGVMIAVMPMAGALTQGIPFSTSIDWALNAMNGQESRDARETKEKVETEEEEDNSVEKKTDSEENAGKKKEEDAGGAKNLEGENKEKEKKIEKKTEKKDDDNSNKGTTQTKEIMRDIRRSEISITARLLSSVIEIYDKGYVALYGKTSGGWVFVLTVAAVVFCWLTKKKEKFKRFREVCRKYPPVILVSVIYIVVYAAPMIGLPDWIPEGRFFAPGHMMLLGVMLLPVDLVFYGLAEIGSDFVMRLLSFGSVVGIYGAAIATGNFRGMLFYELSRYNAAVEVTESIINTFPQYSYTIVSPTDELYPVIQYGWHEELLRFVEQCEGEESYSLPSEYVFIFVEKKPLLYGQSWFFQKVPWLGEEKYLEPFWEVYSARYPDSGASQEPEVISADVLADMDGINVLVRSEKEMDSGEATGLVLPAYENAWDMYLRLENRTVLESKAYDWCQRFAEEHPSVLNIFYEDDVFVCYYFRQEMGNPVYELRME